MEGAELEGVYLRARALCCEAWAMGPWEVERAAGEGLIALEDVVEVVLLRCADPVSGAGVLPWLFREREARRRAKNRELRELAMRARNATTEEERLRIAEAMGRVNARKV